MRILRDKDFKYHQRQVRDYQLKVFLSCPQCAPVPILFFGPNIEKSVFCYEQTTSIVNHRENISFSYIQSAGRVNF